MLKRLELIGFKSFADKTEFEFSAGITAIVGPNGSGKSNIVDAVRWVLGEQSAKSLRGGEMADVIFNGSTSRRSLGLAEVTMTFDNSRGSLATEAAEVQITRRVYRDGEGEYLINQQPSRLKDIKDLFLGSGAGTDAYCVIEQGRVDILLQASTKERRAIFEEAAGISRFKAKKIETLRKLERVEQNLQRLRDIIEEVEKQLRSVKLQAAKAQRAVEYNNRLKELRTAIGLQEYQQLSERLQEETAVLQRMRAGLEEKARQVTEWESETRRLEEAHRCLEEATHGQETSLAAAREQIAAEETTLSRERILSADLEADLSRVRSQLLELTGRVRTLGSAAGEVAVALQDAEALSARQRQDVETIESQLRAAVSRLAELAAQIEADKVEHLEQMRQTARLQNEAISIKAQLDGLRRERERLRLKTTQVTEHLSSLDLELRQLADADQALEDRLVASRQTLTEQRQEREQLRQFFEQVQQGLADLNSQRTGLTSRIDILEGLERSHEGLGSGVREVFALVGQPDPGPWKTVLGMVADVLTVSRDYAPIIDLALGERAQRLIVRDQAVLQDALRQRSTPFTSRVGFLPLASPQPDKSDGSSRPIDEVSELKHVQVPLRQRAVPDNPGVVARADQLVTCESPELADLPARLLGSTLVVRDLECAREIARHTIGHRFVTLQGEVLEDDGTLTVGTHHAETGILSRKSELRELRERVTELDASIAQTERLLSPTRDRMGILDRASETLQGQINVFAEQLADLRNQTSHRRQRREGLHEEVVLSRSEIGSVENEIRDLDQSWARAKEQAESAELQVQKLQARLQSADAESREREGERQARQQDLTAAKVALAQVSERVSALGAKLRQAETDLEQRRQEQKQGQEQLAAVRTRIQESQRTMLRASGVLADRFLQKESAEARLAELLRQREGERQKRQQLAERAHEAQNAWRAQQEQAHARELVVNDMTHHRDTIVDRLREDYQLDLAELYRQVQSGESPPPASLEPTTVNEEIAELRRKLGRLGSVNLDSLQELAELESRASNLHTQLTDLSSAKQSLEEIISKINQDSRRLFSESFHAIRTHFHELFRKLFGGGTAEIVLEDENEILESGIEIIARPPGKELRSISLMSGGEKTLTAVALLLAIFRSKPSPFCILDEVDAALDEANIGRFTTVLREFLDQSHFIIITHSKRTMTVADVLYGITMQESGVSKRVAIRFEDWAESDEVEAAEPAA
jgi:chromosome segregation protein